MSTEINAFDFGKHILKIDKETIRKNLGSKTLRKLFNGALFNEEKFEKMVTEEYNHINWPYNNIKEFFDEMNEQRYCNIKYTITDHNSVVRGVEHKVIISGAGIETFNLNGITNFHIVHGEKIAVIPVEKNESTAEDSFELIIFNHPQVEIPAVGTISIMYDFNTEFSVGEKYSGMLSISRDSSTRFTNNILSGINRDTWYGKPGEVYYRWGDGIYEELNKAIFGGLFDRYPKERRLDQDKLERMLTKDTSLFFRGREKFKMQGTIHFNRSNEFIYQGIIESSGAFPFFLWKDEDKDDKKQHTLKPSPSSVIEPKYN